MSNVHVTIDIRRPPDVVGQTAAGTSNIVLPFYKAYARRNYPRTWQAAARWCEAATPAGPAD